MVNGPSLGRMLFVVSLAGLAGAGPVGKAPASRPAAPGAGPAEGPAGARAVFTELSGQGANALLAGEHGAAVALLLDARQVFDRRMRATGAPVGGPEHVAMLHGLALAYLLNDQPEKAASLFAEGSPLDQACAAKGAPRLLLLTRAVLDLTHGQLAMRSALRLGHYVRDRPDEIDGELLDVLCTAIIAADGQVTGRGTLEQVIAMYEQASARLESTKPGQRRWGVKWVHEAEFDALLRQRNGALQQYQTALRMLEQAEVALSRARFVSGEVMVADPRAKELAAERLRNAQVGRRTQLEVVARARSEVPGIPGLGKAELLRVIEPHKSEVLVLAKPGKPAGAAGGERAGAAPAAPVATTTKTVEFALGLGNGAPKVMAAAGGRGGDGPRGFSRSAAGFAVGPNVLLTAASAVAGARRVVVQFPDAQPVEASVERTGAQGLALLRVQGKALPYLNLAARPFVGGPVQCPTYPEVPVSGVSPESINGRALAAQDEGWKVSLAKHPRLAGAPLLDAAGDLVGVVLGDRGDFTEQLPAASQKMVRAFLGGDLPREAYGHPRAAGVAVVTGSF